jgi:hypothetical protein
MRICDLAWSLWVICCMCSFSSWLSSMLMRGIFLWKMLHFHHGYVTCLYVPLYPVGDACSQIVAIFLVYVSILACCSALCIFAKHMLVFVDLIMHYQQGGGKYPIHVSRGSVHRGKKECASRKENLGEMHLFRGSLHSCIWELFFT